MTALRFTLAAALTAGLLHAAETPKLCALLPTGLNLSLSYNELPDGDFSDLINPYGKICAKDPPCQAGIGRVSTRPGMPSPTDGLFVNIAHFESEKGSRYEARNGERQTPPNSRDFGDTAVVYAGAVSTSIRFAWGPYYAEVFGLGSYASRAAAIARHIDQGLRRLPASCEAAATAELKLPARQAAPSQPPPPMRTSGAPSETTQRRPVEGSGKAAACFPDDAGAAKLDLLEHRAFALTQSPEALRNNFALKVKTLYGCRGFTEEMGKVLFAHLSTLVARQFQDASCFGGDTGVISQDWNSHRNAFQNVQQFYDNLQWKMAAAMKCIRTREQLATFFAEASVMIAVSMGQ
jgi:hypothetical protein